MIAEPGNLEKLIKSLKGQGFEDSARELQSLRDMSWTTGTEMLGEIGLAILRIEKIHKKSFSVDTRVLLKACMKEVRRAFPMMGRNILFSTAMGAVLVIALAAFGWFFFKLLHLSR